MSRGYAQLAGLAIMRSRLRQSLLVATGRAGGKRMVEEGALDGVSVVHGIHVWPSLPAGVIGTRVSVILL